MRISQRSLVYRLAYMPNILYYWFDGVGRESVFPFFFAGIYRAAIAIRTDDGLMMYPPSENVSICTIGWRVLVSPIIALYLIAILPIAVMSGFVFTSAVFMSHFLDDKVEKVSESDESKRQKKTAGLIAVALQYIEAKRRKLCVSVEIVE